MVDRSKTSAETSPVIRLSVTIEKTLHARLVKQAEREERSLASLVRWALIRYLEQVEPDEEP